MSKKKALMLMFTALFVIIVCGLIWFILYGGGSGSNNPDSADATPKTTTSNTKNAADFIASESSLANFDKLLKAAGEDSTLKATGTNFIVIAPNNDAFKNLPKGYYDSLLTTEKQANAQDISKYHIVTVTTDQITAGQKLKTNEGQEIIVGKDGNMFTFTSAKGDTATALKAAYKTSNGSVYVVDNVLLPQ